MVLILGEFGGVWDSRVFSTVGVVVGGELDGPDEVIKLSSISTEISTSKQFILSSKNLKCISTYKEFHMTPFPIKYINVSSFKKASCFTRARIPPR